MLNIDVWIYQKYTNMNKYIKEVEKLKSVSLVTETNGFFRAVLNEEELIKDKEALFEVPNYLRKHGIKAVLDENMPCWEFSQI